MTTLERPARARRVHYPESDGKPMGETDLHRDLMTDLIFALKWFLRSTRAYVAGNLFIYYEEGNPRAAVAPDVFVVLGVEQRRRRIFQTWREGGRTPDVVIEITSKKTRKDDRERKPAIYAALGVREYFIFDPHGEYLEPPLQGYRLVQGVYEPIATDPLRSEVLNLELRQDRALKQP
jgi:Uma2 family endonuclease